MTFFQGLAMLLIAAPLGTIIAALFMGPFAIFVGAAVAIIGALLIIASPFTAGSAECRDCKKRWTIGKAVSPSASTAHPD